MKKTIISLSTILLCGALSAQDLDSGLMFSENDYQGTARTMAMGNAFTALGGDLGSIGINPAGSAVARCFQFTITPGMDFSLNGTKGSVTPDGYGSFQNKVFNAKTGVTLPNLGISLNFDTGRRRGVMNWSLGFVINNTAQYNSAPYALGTNTNTSAFGQLAARAQDLAEDGYFSTSDLLDDSIYDRLAIEDWRVATGYRSGAIASMGGNNFIGISEYEDENGKIRLGQNGVNQTYSESTSGYKSDYIINAGMNISDIVYLGVNIGAVRLRYDSNSYIEEKAVDPDDFDIVFNDDETGEQTVTHFISAKNTFSSSTSGTGVYGKFGIIVTPYKGLRIGAAIQTPTIMYMASSYGVSSTAKYDVNAFSGYEDFKSAVMNYQLRSPMRANFGLAWTFGNFGLVSADYELSNYGSIRYYENGNYRTDGAFYDLNQDIRSRCGVGHNLRIGGEIRPLSFMYVRAGYGFQTSGKKYDIVDNSLVKLKFSEMAVHTASVGLGFITSRSFFADIAAVGQIYPMSYIRPYGDYIYNAATGEPQPYSPEIRHLRTSIKLVATFGWRF
ncbi:MAG: hypothetical protein ACI39U_01690 [Candidatus Cryptobacteroides sp.]